MNTGSEEHNSVHSRRCLGKMEKRGERELRGPTGEQGRGGFMDIQGQQYQVMQ